MSRILDTQVAETNKVFGKTNTFLLNSVLALFHRGYLGSYDKQFVESTLQTLELIKDPGLHIESSISFANDILTGVIIELSRLEDAPSPEWLEVRLKPLKVDHFEYIRVIISEFSDIASLSEDQIKDRYKIYRELCDKYKEGYLVKSMAREAFGHVLNGDEFSAIDTMKSTLERIEPLLSRKSNNSVLNVPGVSQFVRSDDQEAMRAEFKEAAETIDTRSILKCGIQGWDRSLSDYGGMIRGCVAEIQAISGGSKSDTARAYLTGVARHTKPFLLDPKKKACLVYLTLEDTIARSLSRTLTQIRREDQDRFDVEEVNEDQAYDLYREIVEQNGYTVFNIKGKQKELTPRNVLALLEAIQDDGYEIHLLVADYFGLLSFSDIEEANNSEAIKTGYSYVFNFCQENKIAALLCAQIAGREYNKVVEGAENDGLKELVHANLSSQSMNIINVLDVRIMVNTVKGANRAVHQWAVGKNRFGTALSENDKYCVYDLHRAVDTRDGIEKPAGFIKPDHNEECRALRGTPQNLGMDEDDEIIAF